MTYIKNCSVKSNIVNEVTKTISSLFIFFNENILNAQKGQKGKTNNFQRLRSCCVREKLLPLVF